MLLAEIYDVNPVRDGWDWIAFGAGIAGALGAAIAIGFAVAAQRATTATRRDAIDERQRICELEVLRELVRDLDTTGLHREAWWKPGLLRIYQQRLALIASPDTMPFWRRLVELDWADEVVLASGLGEFRGRQRQLSQDVLEHVKAQPAWVDQQAW